MINIYDGNNYYRKTLETDRTGLAPRGIVNALQMTSSFDTTVWCWDGEKSNARRREWYPEYKRNRKPVDKDIYVGFDLLKDVLKHTSAIQIEVPGYEADDVIASLARHYARRGQHIAVYSNDYDLLQLSSEFPAHILVGAQPKTSVPNRFIRHYKCLVGDPSDNIPGVKGFGEKTWEAVGIGNVGSLIYSILHEPDEEGVQDLDDFNLPKAVLNWLDVKENREQIKTFWNVVGLINIPMEEINDHIIEGDGDYQKAEAILKEYML